MDAELIDSLGRVGFPVWAGSDKPLILDVVTWNGRARSVTLVDEGQRTLIRSRFRVAGALEQVERKEFMFLALDLWRDAALEDFASRRPDAAVVETLAIPLANIGFGLIGGSVTLETLGYPHAALDLCLAAPTAAITLRRLAELTDLRTRPRSGR